MKGMTLEEIDRRISEINQKENLSKDLKDELSKLRIEKMYVAPPAACNDVLDLRTYMDNKPYYLIFLHNTRTWVGSINYRGYHYSDYSGDAECTIVPQFRGNGYAFEALKLLGEKLYEDKILDFWVSAHKDNLASIKTIEKYGGKRIKPTSHSDENVILFECKTFPRETKKNCSELDRNISDTERE